MKGAALRLYNIDPTSLNKPQVYLDEPEAASVVYIKPRKVKF